MIVFPAMPVRNPCVGIAFQKTIFSPDECHHIIQSINEASWEEGLVGDTERPGQFHENAAKRSCRQQRLSINANGFPINRIGGELCQANSDGWKFELSGLVADDMPWVMRDRKSVV